MVEENHRPADDAALATELELVFPQSGAWTRTPLLHNLANAVTGDIFRVQTADRSAVVKLLSADNDGHAGHWHAREEPDHWNYWRREQYVYSSRLPARLGGGGLTAPALLGVFPRGESEIALWLEDLSQESAGTWTVGDLAGAAHALGVGQARVHADPTLASESWLSRGYLRDYSTSKNVDWSLMDDDGAWAQPVIQEHWPASLRRDMVRLFAERDAWLTLIEGLPRTLCHLDFWPNNLLRRGGGEFAVVDWSFAGDGAIGEDVGNLVPDSVFDHFLPASALTELDAAVFDGYLSGLRAGGWRGEEQTVRLAMCASAVKYLFLVPRLLADAGRGEFLAYGGAEVLPAALRYGERGTVLAFLAGWAQEARELVDAGVG